MILSLFKYLIFMFFWYVYGKFSDVDKGFLKLEVRLVDCF